MKITFVAKEPENILTFNTPTGTVFKFKDKNISNSVFIVVNKAPGMERGIVTLPTGIYQTYTNDIMGEEIIIYDAELVLT